MLRKAAPGRAEARDYSEPCRNCGKRPRRERLRLLKPYSSFALDGREMARGNGFSEGQEWSINGPMSREIGREMDAKWLGNGRQVLLGAYGSLELAWEG